MKKILIYSTFCLLSLPLSQYASNALGLGQEFISLYWIALGLCCFTVFAQALKIESENILFRSSQVFNFAIGCIAISVGTLQNILPNS